MRDWEDFSFWGGDRMKPKYLYHGSRKKLVRGMLKPMKAGSLGRKAEDKLTAVYATNKKNAAIVMAIISGAKLSSMEIVKGVAKGIIYKGWPKREEIYLYYLYSKDFIKLKGDSWQWVSHKPVKPIKVEKLKNRDYIHLIRKATKKEKDMWRKEYGKL